MSKGNGKIKVGGKIVEHGRVYRIFKITEDKNNGELVRVIHYKPYYSSTTNGADVICSIPESSLEDANIRFPTEKTDLIDIISGLTKTTIDEEDLDVISAKDRLKENDIVVSVEILRTFWYASKKEEGFTKSKRDVLGLAFERVVEEIALVNGVTLTKAREEIEVALGG